VTPSPHQVRTFLLDQIEAWNRSDRGEFVRLHRQIAPNGFKVQNPVDGPVREGWQALDELWDAYQKSTRLRYTTVITAKTGEAAVLEEITREAGGARVVGHSLHTYDFADDALHARYFSLQSAPTGNPARDRFRNFLLEQSGAWNDGRREDCFGLYDEISCGRMFLEYPLGSAETEARPVLENFWDQMQNTTRLIVDHIGVSDNGKEAAMCVRNEHANNGAIDTRVSIEIYKLADDGLHIRYFS
jgi:hypothetical protein